MRVLDFAVWRSANAAKARFCRCSWLRHLRCKYQTGWQGLAQALHLPGDIMCRHERTAVPSCCAALRESEWRSESRRLAHISKECRENDREDELNLKLLAEMNPD